MLDTFACSGALIWLFSPAWDAVELTLKAGFICLFVVDDPTYLGATIMVAQALCLSIFNLSPTQKTCLFTDGNKAKCLLHRCKQIMGISKQSLKLVPLSGQTSVCSGQKIIVALPPNSLVDLSSIFELQWYKWRRNRNSYQCSKYVQKAYFPRNTASFIET